MVNAQNAADSFPSPLGGEAQPVEKVQLVLGFFAFV